MNSEGDKKYIKYTWFVLFMIFLVILAGGIVRMTQSGMGCPDWPTCFGRWIPPINESQLPPDFEKYLGKQDIDHSFNVYHTWIEYINRLLGAILGLFIIFHTIWSTRYRKSRKSIFWLSILMLFLVGFQGWLGKVVVDHNLNEVKITIHMVVALLIAMIPLGIISKFYNKITVDKSSIWAISITCILIIIQVVLGTQVREEIDIISKSLSYGSRELWIERLGNGFIIHRSYSWVLIIMSIYILFELNKIEELRVYGRLQFIIFLVVIMLGIFMNYFNMPAIAQPLHLLFASLIFCLMFFIRLKVKK